MKETDLAFASRTLHGRVEVFVRRLSKVVSKASDKAVHETRVESRRMRAALEAFQALFPPNPFSVVHRDIRRITRLLGKPRETAVSLDLMHDLTDEAKVESSCRKVLDARLNSRLKKQVARLQKKIKRIDPLRIRSRLDFLLSVMELDAANAAETPGTQPIQQLVLFPGRENAVFLAARILSMVISPIAQYRVENLFDAATDEELHSLRIAAKKARYAMEIYAPIWPGGLKEHISIARKFQDAAGSYHDWGVLGQYLTKEAGRLKLCSADPLLSETGRLAACAASRQKNLKPIMRASLLELQDRFASLDSAIRLLALRARKNPPLLKATSRSKRQRAVSGSPARKPAASH
jgi:CHAD domain-containing protein